MAQHPEKLKWKEQHPYGLSASQFGMVLGFCGRVSDYVHYLRHVVGTENEFKGNTCTAHGIVTEPKSRALYELLTGCEVHNGGFFVTADRILGCSPDGQIFYAAEDKSMEQRGTRTATATTSRGARSSTLLSSTDVSCLDGQQQERQRSSVCSVRVPFKSKRRARSPFSMAALPSSSPSSSRDGGSSSELPSRTAAGGLTSPLAAMQMSSPKVESPPVLSATMDSATSSSSSASPLSSPALNRKVRLLEIKSPFRALYDNTKPSYAPFGIPLHYMCQIQGQLAIADCEECDFFVYLDHPVCQVEAWRVHRSREFWRWAEPNLRQVSEWVKDGPPDWLNRSFAFRPFDFSRIEVVPLVFPFDITAGAALRDARRFSFFTKHLSPYEALSHHREPRGRSREFVSSGEAQRWCRGDGGTSWADLTEHQRIALAVQAPVVRYLFNTNDNREDDTLDAGSTGEDERARRTSISDGGRFCQTLSTWRRLLESEGRYENSATAELWRSLTCTASAGRDPLVEISVAIPEDWEEAHTSVRCTLLHSADGDGGSGSSSDQFSDTTPLPFFQRRFLISLLPALEKKKCAKEAPPSLATEGVSQRAYATPLAGVPCFLSSPVRALQPTQFTPTSPKKTLLRKKLGACVPASNTRGTTAVGANTALLGNATAATAAVSFTEMLTEERQRIVASLSQQIRQSHASQCATGDGDHDLSPLSDKEKLKHEAILTQDPTATLSTSAPQCLRCEIAARELCDVVQFSDDCDGVLLMYDARQSPVYYRRSATAGHRGNTFQAENAVFTLLVADGEVLRTVLMECRGDAARFEASLAHPRVVATCKRLLDLPSHSDHCRRNALVPCFIDVVESCSAASMAARSPAILPDGTPCFLIQDDANVHAVMRQVEELMETWERTSPPY
ncbi:hypothetical protein ABB37_01203 [Leptomonas pyrrhocoris]|uniref:YqaJ viral recombinase domain-containing protein n=1 Tax=Leptomonas pyrrhocoris TaxID=157538 RepID=A0A0N0VH97_LEPPY|nr:hypothetical protein ABB37_01203 [Leptomonas pyrrhocoris]KPA84698.1 hypothetical protein ABB37_01203 [Leptomonas pyrrhocoris]|eukprot:XP_015663137.1 hypothetical protein ABB37_01203 [Leptomonas pyrrhocoris]